METDSLTADPEEAALRELGHQTDMNQGRPLPESDGAEPAEPRAPAEAQTEEGTQESQPPEIERPEQQPDSSETEPKEAQKQPQERRRDPVTGLFVKEKGERPETEYSRAQKEEIRKERTWQTINARKEQLAAEQAQWEEQKRMEQLEQARKQYQPLRKDGLTAQEYAEGARRFEQEGDYENAYKAHQVALEIHAQEQGRVQQAQAVESEYQWRTQMQQAIQAEPQIANPDSPISQHLGRIIDQNPWIYHIPNGFLRAAEVAHMLSKMGSISELQDENIKLRAELEKHQRKTQPAKGGFASPSLEGKSFDDMSLDEQEAELGRMTREADNYR